MRKSDRDYLILLGCFSAGVLLFVFLNREPVYQGQPLRAWLRELTSEKVGDRKLAEIAVWEIGTDGLPCLVSVLRSADTNAQARSVRAFEVLGSNAGPAIPQLARLLNRADTALSAGRALAAVGPATVPYLIEGVASPDKVVRTSSARALGRLRAEAKLAVPTLVGVLNDEDDDLRYFAARALGHIHQDPDRAVPALAAKLEDPNAEVRKIAARSLSLYRREARGAVPALLRVIHHPDEHFQRVVRFALKEIDPDAASKAGLK